MLLSANARHTNVDFILLCLLQYANIVMNSMIYIYYYNMYVMCVGLAVLMMTENTIVVAVVVVEQL